MLFHWRQDTQIALHPSGIVITDIVFNHLDEVPLTGEPSAVVALPLQNPPEAFHRAVINAVGNTGHTLRHSRLHKLLVKCPVCVLETSVAVKQGMCVRTGLHRLVKGFENQRIIVVLTEHMGHDAPVTEIQNGAQIEFVNLNSLIPFEFCYIGEPLLVGLCGIELPIQKVLSKILRIFRLPGAATVAVLDRGADIPGPADTKHSLVVDMDTVVMTQIVIKPPIALVRTFCVDLLNLVRKSFIFGSSLAQLPGIPFVVSRASYMEQFAGHFNGIALFRVCFPDGSIDMALSYFRKASLLSISSNFFSRSRSISARYSLCLSCSISICAFSSSVLGV